MAESVSQQGTDQPGRGLSGSERPATPTIHGATWTASGAAGMQQQGLRAPGNIALGGNTHAASGGSGFSTPRGGSQQFAQSTPHVGASPGLPGSFHQPATLRDLQFAMQVLHQQQQGMQAQLNQLCLMMERSMEMQHELAAHIVILGGGPQGFSGSDTGGTMSNAALGTVDVGAPVEGMEGPLQRSAESEEQAPATARSPQRTISGGDKQPTSPPREERVGASTVAPALTGGGTVPPAFTPPASPPRENHRNHGRLDVEQHPLGYYSSGGGSNKLLGNERRPQTVPRSPRVQREQLSGPSTTTGTSIVSGGTTTGSSATQPSSGNQSLLVNGSGSTQVSRRKEVSEQRSRPHDPYHPAADYSSEDDAVSMTRAPHASERRDDKHAEPHGYYRYSSSAGGLGGARRHGASTSSVGTYGGSSSKRRGAKPGSGGNRTSRGGNGYNSDSYLSEDSQRYLASIGVFLR